MSNKTFKTGEFCWNELMTGDTQKAKAFYAELFGWSHEEHDVGNGIKYTMFKTGSDMGGAGMMQIPQEKEGQIPPHWMSYIYVEDLESHVAKAQKLGATITMPITPAGDYGRFAIIKDPTGANIALWQSLKSCA